MDELGLDQSVDTLGRWMAHYIAELIQAAETAGSKDRAKKLRTCAVAVLDIWRHRSALPNGRRPFEDLEPILKTLKDLDSNDDTPTYFRSVRTAATGEEQSEIKKWLDLANDIDHSARILISYYLARAAENALDRSKNWVSLAQAAGTEEGTDLRILNFLSDETELLNSTIPDGRARREIKARIERLERFVKMSNALLDELRAKLKL